ncbi:MAG: type II toxin-antitoxin system RelE/ParE family toxin [Candidatus Paceibacterota bacterium]
MSQDILKVAYSIEFEKILKRISKKDKRILDYLEVQIEKTIRFPEIGKPLRYTLKNRRRLDVGSFVLIYEFSENEVRFIDFDHHDKIYKKYKFKYK